jgi:hypothetical protein
MSVRWYPWCPTCGQVAANESGEECIRCRAAFEAEWNPIDRTKTPPMEPRGPVLRFLRWLGGVA